ncbi:hypothetical protein RhiJN_21058 [Ceratobasidium sp. AG-Ba]|nr:hypothetical protein RhiJN_21058 [Ceratobasidium sp. AG-Ba]
MLQQQTTFPAAINLSAASTDDILQWLVAAVTHVNQQAVTDTQHFNTELAAAGAAVSTLQTSVNQLIAAQGGHVIQLDTGAGGATPLQAPPLIATYALGGDQKPQRKERKTREKKQSIKQHREREKCP